MAAEDHVLTLSPQPPLLGVWSQPGTKPLWCAANAWAAVPWGQGECARWKQSWGLVHEIWNWMSSLFLCISEGNLGREDQEGKVGTSSRERMAELSSSRAWFPVSQESPVKLCSLMWSDISV